MPRVGAEHRQNTTKTAQKQCHSNDEVFTTILVQRMGGESPKSGSWEDQRMPMSVVARIRPADQYVAPRPFSGAGGQYAQNARKGV